MAYPAHRSANRDMEQGMVDGRYKQVSPNRGGVVEQLTIQSRGDLCDTWYGFHECDRKMLPDGLTASTPTYAPTAPAHCCGC